MSRRYRFVPLAAVAVSVLTLLQYGAAFVGSPGVNPRSAHTSRGAPSVVRHAEEAAAPAATAAAADASDDRYLGAWRYAGGAYEIRRTDGKLFFHENVFGELVPKGEWLEADLPPAGTIRLKLSADGNNVLSNFKATDGEAWADTITAVREWETLNRRASDLEGRLKALQFEGASGDGSVVVSVDGKQRPTAVKISPSAASSKDLGALLKEAHAAATETSLSDTTEMVRELYAAHFAARPVPN
eukprot:TRINITY_DN100963_c0_g1_i1.p1 TRINITY_DN100963_c0_g1~~TRINITY_DN100963_c0_g1_i1.p1  ORF type:complete len:243 (+),score=63.44 TRINITY_DN100963_c0_g1_i1:73-801(+)